MKMLYISSLHSTLEYDDLILFSELGIDWFSIGIYLDPSNPVFLQLRPPIDKKVDRTLVDKFQALNLNTKINTHTVVKLDKDFLDNFDVIFISNNKKYLELYADRLSNKKIIYRSYDSPNAKFEDLLKKCMSAGNTSLVRMFDWENKLKFSNTSNYVISSYVDPDIYDNWNGQTQEILTFQNDYFTRLNHVDLAGIHVYPNYAQYLKILRDVPCRLHGVNNKIEACKGPVDWETQKRLYRDCRAYFSLGSKPSWYTYNLMEAMMTGMPVITFGKQMGTYQCEHFKETYILPDLINNGTDGYCLDDTKDLLNACKTVLKDFSTAQAISINSRKFALKYFSKSVQKEKWKEFFKLECGYYAP